MTFLYYCTIIPKLLDTYLNPKSRSNSSPKPIILARRANVLHTFGVQVESAGFSVSTVGTRKLEKLRGKTCKWPSTTVGHSFAALFCVFRGSGFRVVGLLVGLQSTKLEIWTFYCGFQASSLECRVSMPHISHGRPGLCTFFSPRKSQ